jgi:cell shape-determining protein MreC
MIKKILKLTRMLAPPALIAVFSVFVFGQGQRFEQVDTPFEAFIRVAGWIAIVGAGVTYVVMNVYNAVRGKNYEQLEESLKNYKELAESRKAREAELAAKYAFSEAERIRLETENERLAEKILRI